MNDNFFPLSEKSSEHKIKRQSTNCQSSTDQIFRTFFDELELKRPESWTANVLIPPSVPNFSYSSVSTSKALEQPMNKTETSEGNEMRLRQKTENNRENGYFEEENKQVDHTSLKNWQNEESFGLLKIKRIYQPNAENFNIELLNAPLLDDSLSSSHDRNIMSSQTARINVPSTGKDGFILETEPLVQISETSVYLSRNILRILFAFAFQTAIAPKNLRSLSKKESGSGLSKKILRSAALKKKKISPGMRPTSGAKSPKNFLSSYVGLLIQKGQQGSLFPSLREGNQLSGSFLELRSRKLLGRKRLFTSLTKLFFTDSLPTIRLNQRKIPVIPILICIIPYVLFLGVRQTFLFLGPESKVGQNLSSSAAIAPQISLVQTYGAERQIKDQKDQSKQVGDPSTWASKLFSKTSYSLKGELTPSKTLSIRRLMSSYRPIEDFERGNQVSGGEIDQSQALGLNLFERSASSNGNLHETDWVLGLPATFSKFFVLWAVQLIASIRPQRKMTQKAEQSQQARILFPNEIRVQFENLQGLTGVLPLLNILIHSLNAAHENRNTFFSRAAFDFVTQHSKKYLTNSNSQSFAQEQTNGSFYGSSAKYPKGYLFVGPPGTGKTRLAQALAKEAKVPLLCVSASEIQKQIEIGTRIGALRLRKVFEKAREYAPCILFFDEIDAIGKTRGHEISGDNQLLTEFLIQMDSFSVRDGFVVVGTTNYLSHLDSAFIRSGRFDRIVSLNSPSKKIRADILQAQVRTTGFDSNIPWNYLAHYSKGFSPAHLSRLINESLLYSLSMKAKLEDFDLGSQKDSLRSEKIKFQAIYEEIGFFSAKPKHSFESLQHGFNRIQNHRKNFSNGAQE